MTNMSSSQHFRHACHHGSLLASVLLALPAAAQQEPAKEVSTEQNLNFPTSTLGGAQFWSDELVFHRWRIQLNVFTGHYRLLDENDYRRAWGTFEQCKDKLDAIRREKELPPMKGTAVVTLHGLIRSREVMNGMGEFLEQEGDMTWINVSYASTRRSLDDHAASLAKIIDNLEGIDQIHFVCHSLGNLVVRRYLGEATQPNPKWKVDSRIKRFVMLGPPNNGAHMAELFKDNKLFGLLMGPSGKQIATWPEVEKQMGIGKCEFAIIAGSLTGSFTNPLVRGDDDLIVGVEETKLAGARDFLGVPLNHGNLVDDPYVRKKALSFLKNGYFIAEDLRHPIEVVAKPRGGP
jgi:pimeloyl-ACP methyl ester carboxylesterase